MQEVEPVFLEKQFLGRDPNRISIRLVIVLFCFTAYYISEQREKNANLFLVVGFGVLVEWGHTNYINNITGKIETTPQPLPFYGIKTKEDLMEEILSWVPKDKNSKTPMADLFDTQIYCFGWVEDDGASVSKVSIISDTL